ncbi:MAG: 1-acyl-sn-glycerol-3-phosphate acyltransferase [Myxococcales bacterium]|jgi:1-acyl-sn-glycerol-3-phosphate acyltransferase|nr:1-acyl-sn-glycerol-3-phosphate acyltransferase [Myxococcales bacterium]
MKSLKRIALSIFLYPLFILVAVLLLPVMLLTAIVCSRDPTRRYPGWLLRAYGRFIVACIPDWKFSVEGNVPEDIGRRGYVVIANHSSTGDIYLLSTLPWDMRWVAKAELLRLPLMGQLLWLSGDILLKRGNKQSVLRMFEACRTTLKHGLPVMIFPEGTRSKDGLRPFKDGAFQIALETGAPILPLALTGTRQSVSSNGVTLGQMNARIRILDPIPTEGRGPEALAELRDEARRRIEEAIGQMNQADRPRIDASPLNQTNPSLN